MKFKNNLKLELECERDFYKKRAAAAELLLEYSNACNVAARTFLKYRGVNGFINYNESLCLLDSIMCAQAGAVLKNIKKWDAGYLLELELKWDASVYKCNSLKNKLSAEAVQALTDKKGDLIVTADFIKTGRHFIKKDGGETLYIKRCDGFILKNEFYNSVKSATGRHFSLLFNSNELAARVFHKNVFFISEMDITILEGFLRTQECIVEEDLILHDFIYYLEGELNEMEASIEYYSGGCRLADTQEGYFTALGIYS